ncbi:MAG: threonine-phosphate decarboxylase CobD [Pseudomonadota bacterium]
MINGHGGNIFDKARDLGCDPMDILDMSSNVNPLGPMPGLMNHLHEHLERIIALPEAGAGSIIQAFSSRHDIDSKKVLAGNGTTQLIYTLPVALKIRQALILGPTYSDYADACRMHGVDFRFALSDEKKSFRHTLDAMAIEPCDAVFICNPNNPTGTLIPSETIESLCRRYPNIRFIIDESYLPFVPEGEAKSLIRSTLPNIIVLNSMSKIFRIPGLRIGFVVAHPDIIDKISPYMLPWSVNTLAQAAVNYLMTQKQDVLEFIEKTRTYLAEEREFVMADLQSAPGIQLFPSTTSFILAKLDRLTAESVSRHLLHDRILIRDCGNFQGLSSQFIRISLKTRDVNQILTDRLRACCENAFS